MDQLTSFNSRDQQQKPEVFFEFLDSSLFTDWGNCNELVTVIFSGQNSVSAFEWSFGVGIAINAGLGKLHHLWMNMED